MRELLKALSELETQLINTYGISLNEAMVLCSIGGETVTAGMIVERTGMTPSHASKTISLIEKKRNGYQISGQTRQTSDVFHIDRKR